MFEKILIANRGEIACRIARTARRLGVLTVSVYSDPDHNALFTRTCDSAIPLGGATPTESYLDIDKIISAASESGAEAIHPGYGFLSENAEFADRCRAAGLVFIGPGPEAIRIMGSKDSARSAAQDAGVPVLPGYDGEDQDPEALLRHAEAAGYPVLIKATAGGGGKGMRVVASSGDFLPSLESVKRESLSAFGDDRVLIEKYMPTARHIEIQIFSDSHGNAVHLFERDCSMQRRYQKVIEESPAPGMSERLRNSMTRAAVDCTRAIDYVGAGTIEFLVDSDRFYFLEMNTRLQVEHPVTEMVTGLDLVEWQLRVACGEPLPCSQEDIRLNGHAIEARIYAENPGRGFLPATGDILLIDHPADADPGGRIRVDTGIDRGSRITPHYDPMISKLIAWDKDRDGARRKLADALRRYRILGVPTNTGFLQSTLELPDLVKGRYDTQYLTRHLDDILAQAPQYPLAVHCACAWMFLGDLKTQRERQAREADRYTPWLAPGRLFTQPPRRYRFECAMDNERHDLDFTFDEGRFEFEDGVILTARIADNGCMEVAGPGHRARISAANTSTAVFIHMEGRHHRIGLIDSSRPERDGPGAGGTVFSPMPGTVIEVQVQPGRTVRQGDRLLCVEAMKMEHEILAPAAGTVKAVHCNPGDSVTENTPLVLIEAA